MTPRERVLSVLRGEKPDFVPWFADLDYYATAQIAQGKQPVGDVAVGDWPGFRAGSDVIYWGGIPGSYFTPMVSDDEFDRHVKEVLEVMRNDGRMVLGVADPVPPDGMERRIRRVSELVEDFGAY